MNGRVLTELWLLQVWLPIEPLDPIQYPKIFIFIDVYVILPQFNRATQVVYKVQNVLIRAYLVILPHQHVEEERKNVSRLDQETICMNRIKSSDNDNIKQRKIYTRMPQHSYREILQSIFDIFMSICK